MRSLGIDTICFNWMAHIGWLRTRDNIPERGEALVTGFDMKDFVPTGKTISEEELWYNYKYFLSAVMPYAEKYEINVVYIIIDGECHGILLAGNDIVDIHIPGKEEQGGQIECTWRKRQFQRTFSPAGRIHIRNYVRFGSVPVIDISIPGLISSLICITGELEGAQSVACEPRVKILTHLEEQVIQSCSPSVNRTPESLLSVEGKRVQSHGRRSHIRIHRTQTVMQYEIHPLTRPEGEFVFGNCPYRNTGRTL